MLSDPAQAASNVSLTKAEYKHYGRQMILPSWGLPGQLALKSARVAVVGAGGLGCPVLQYLAGAGVGTIDVWDHDEVSVSNLHRQILHTAEGAEKGEGKAESAARAMRALNPHITVLPHAQPILPETALFQLAPAQVIVDCTDRPLTRYLLSDAAVRLGIPLVSGAAIADLGQWAVYGGLRLVGSTRLSGSATAAGPSTSSSSSSSVPGPSNAQVPRPVQEGEHGSNGNTDRRARACYRCIWPKPLPGASGRCEDTGVWGVVTGMVGTGMAGEVIKLIMGKSNAQPMLQTLHLQSTPLIRSTRLRPARPDCPSCSSAATIGLVTNPSTGRKEADLSSVDYVAFCAGAGGDAGLEDEGWEEYTNPGDEHRVGVRSGERGAEGRVDVRDLARIMSEPSERAGSGTEAERGEQGESGGGKGKVRLVDTRSETEFGICAVPGSINIPLNIILKDPLSALTLNPTSVIDGTTISSTRATDASPAAGAAGRPATESTSNADRVDTIFICRLGNDSRVAAHAVRAALNSRSPTESDSTRQESVESAAAMRVMDVRGGLRAWGREVDPDFPLYF